jgi:WD40 repeat protein
MQTIVPGPDLRLAPQSVETANPDGSSVATVECPSDIPFGGGCPNLVIQRRDLRQAARPEPIHSSNPESRVTAQAFDPTGDQLASAWTVDNSSNLRLVGPGSADRVLAPGAQLITALTFSDDGHTLAAAGPGQVMIWDTRTAQVHAIRSIQTDTAPATAAMPHQGTSTLAVGFDSGQIDIWPLDSSKSPASLLGDHSKVLSISYAPDDRLLAVGHEDGTLELWDLDSMSPAVPPMQGHNVGVRALAFSSDGDLLASGDSDGGVIVWDTASGRPVGAPLHGPAARKVNGLAFVEHDRLLRATIGDLTLVWPVGLDDEELRRRVCQVALSGATTDQQLDQYQAALKTVQLY